MLHLDICSAIPEQHCSVLFDRRPSKAGSRLKSTAHPGDHSLAPCTRQIARSLNERDFSLPVHLETKDIAVSVATELNRSNEMSLSDARMLGLRSLIVLTTT